MRPFLGSLLMAACAACRPDDNPPHEQEPQPEDPGPWGFVDITVSTGLKNFLHEPFNTRGSIDAYDHGNGLAAGDFDGDGHEDLLILTQCGPTGYFLGNGDGTFRDQSSALSMLNDGVRVGVAYADYDEDGDTDFYVTFVRRPNALLRQEADGSFTDVAAEAGVAVVGHWSGAAFFDADRDGDLELAVAANLTYSFEDTPIAGDERCAAGFKGMNMGDIQDLSQADGPRFFVNGGPASDFTFTDESASRGMPSGSEDPELVRGFGDLLLLDFDRDRDVDLFFPEMFAGRSALLENDGTGHYQEVTTARIPQPSYGSTGAAVADFDGDGWPDLFASDMHADMWIPPSLPFEEVEADVRYLDHQGPGGQGPGDNASGPLYGNTLWLSGGDGAAWEERALDWGAETFNPWGGLAADFDGDTDLDLFVPSGMSNPFAYFPNILLENTGEGFEQAQDRAGLAPPPWGIHRSDVIVHGEQLTTSLRGTALADFDEDGDQDLAVLSWRDGVRLLRLDRPEGHHWLSVQLIGDAPRDPFGTEVELVAGGKSQVRWMDASRGYLSQSTRLVHFGLGATAEVDSVTVRWLDGTETVIDAPPADAVLRIER